MLKVWADFTLRLAFFAAAPFFVVLAAELYPVTGAVVQVALALAVFLLGETTRRSLGRHRAIRAILARELAFEAFYREHPPRTFLYYVFYPVFAPYWLVQRDARREFWLYKGYTWPAFALLVVSLIVQYVRAGLPDISLVAFLPIAAGSLIAEAVVVLMFLMPIVTSVVHYHREHASRRLSALLIVGLISLGYAVVRMESRRHPIVSVATRERAKLRSEARPERALASQTAALNQALAHLPGTTRREDGPLTGEALEAAQSTLAAFYKHDEAAAFELWYTRAPLHVTLYFRDRRGHAPIWLSMDAAHRVSHDEAELTARAKRALGLGAPGSERP